MKGEERKKREESKGKMPTMHTKGIRGEREGRRGEGRRK